MHQKRWWVDSQPPDIVLGRRSWVLRTFKDLFAYSDNIAPLAVLLLVTAGSYPTECTARKQKKKNNMALVWEQPSSRLGGSNNKGMRSAWIRMTIVNTVIYFPRCPSNCMEPRLQLIHIALKIRLISRPSACLTISSYTIMLPVQSHWEKCTKSSPLFKSFWHLLFH